MLLATFCSTIAFSQIIETAFFPVYDSLGQITYIKKSDVKDYKHPTKATKIVRFNYQTDTVGYWVGDKLRFVPQKKKR